MATPPEPQDVSAPPSASQRSTTADFGSSAGTSAAAATMPPSPWRASALICEEPPATLVTTTPPLPNAGSRTENVDLPSVPPRGGSSIAQPPTVSTAASADGALPRNIIRVRHSMGHVLRWAWSFRPKQAVYLVG